MPEILLTSGWQTCNIGDIGHTPGTLAFWEKYIPEASLSVYLHNWNDAVMQMLKDRFPAVTLIGANSKQHCTPEGELLDTRLDSAFGRADLVVQNSGMHYNGFYDVDPWLIRKCVQEGKPYGLYGQSFDGFTDIQMPDMLKMLSEAAFISCRDMRSVEYLHSLDLQPGWLGFGPDGCFGIDVRDDERGEALLKRLALDRGEFLALVLRSNTTSSDPSCANVLNPLHISESDRLENERWASQLINVIRGWIEHTGKPVILAPEVDKEIPAAHSLIWDQLPSSLRPYVREVQSFWNVDEAASVYAMASAVVSMEPHSCIIALANGVPAIHFYSPKHGVKAQMFADIGLSEWLCDINRTSAEMVIRELMRIESDRGEAVNRVNTAMQRVHGYSRSVAEVIRQQLGLSTPISSPAEVLT